MSKSFSRTDTLCSMCDCSCCMRAKVSRPEYDRGGDDMVGKDVVCSSTLAMVGRPYRYNPLNPSVDCMRRGMFRCFDNDVRRPKASSDSFSGRGARRYSDSVRWLSIDERADGGAAAALADTGAESVGNTKLSSSNRIYSVRKSRTEALPRSVRSVRPRGDDPEDASLGTCGATDTGTSGMVRAARVGVDVTCASRSNCRVLRLCRSSPLPERCTLLFASFMARISLCEACERSRGGGGDDDAFESGDDDICASNALGK